MSGKGGATDLVRPRSVSERLADLPASTAQAPDGGRQTGGYGGLWLHPLPATDSRLC